MPCVAILHNIRSVHNVGSIFRTADGAGFDKIYLCGITPIPVDRFGRPRQDLAKVALGAEQNVAWESAKNTAAVIKRLKKEDYQIFALEQVNNSIRYNAPFDFAWGTAHDEQKIALIVGDEVRGLSQSVLKLADRVIEIPMYGKKESLNVAVAFGIAAFRLAEFMEQ